MLENHESRTWSSALELRQAPGRSPRLEGYAVVWGALSRPLGRRGLRERFAPYAFGEAEIRTVDPRGDVLATIEHDQARLLGRRRAGTLELRQDDRGLFVGIDTPPTRDGEDLVAQVRRGDIDQMSFTFLVEEEPPGDRLETVDGVQVRTVTAASLLEVTATAVPAYEQTELSLAARSLLARSDHADIERRIRLAELAAQIGYSARAGVAARTDERTRGVRTAGG